MAKLVIIDDEAAILELMSKLCRAAGHTVFGYTTGLEGMAAIRSHAPDLVIVDLRIGDVNGLDLVSMTACGSGNFTATDGVNVIVVNDFLFEIKNLGVTP